MCLENEIELIQVCEDDLLYKNDIIKSILNKKINNKLKIDSSLCKPEFSYIISVVRKTKNNKLELLRVYDSGKIKFNLKGKNIF